MDVFVTEANSNNASLQWCYNLETHCSALVPVRLRKRHLHCGVEGHVQSVTEAKGREPSLCARLQF